MNSNDTTRIVAFDHVRAVAVILMIVSHVGLMFGSADFGATALGRFMNDFCGTAPAAPVFMMLMGIFFVFPKDKPVSAKIIRGIKLFVLDILLNVVRMVIPFYILSLYAPTEFERMREMLQAPPEEFYSRLLYNMDILGFAGVAYVLLALLQAFLKNTWQWILAGVVIVFAAPYLWGVGENLGPVFYILQPLWGRPLIENVPTDTAFPAFPWLIYPLMGVIIGRYFMSGSREPQVLRGMVIAGLTLAVFGGAMVAIFGMQQFGDYYRMFAGGTALVMSFALLWAGIFMWFNQRSWFQAALNRINFWSEHITLIYCVQWFWFGFSILLLKFRLVDNPWVLLALIPVFFALTWLVTRFLLRFDRLMKCFYWFTR